MTQLTADFEVGVDGNAIQVADAGSANAWNVVSRAGSSRIDYSNTHAHRGSLSAKFNAITASSHWLEWGAALGSISGTVYGRCYLWMDALPSGGDFYWHAAYDNVAALIGRFRFNTSGQIVIQNSAGGTAATGAVAAATGQWIRLEWEVILSATIGQMTVKLFNSADSTTPAETVASAANLNTRTTYAQARLGPEQPPPLNFISWMDDIVEGATSYPGPSILAGGSAQEMIAMANDLEMLESMATFL